MQVPEVGQVYRHYKSKGGGDHTYQVIGLARHTETDEVMVVYKPLYENSWFKGVRYAVRPLSMWFEQVTVNDKIVTRFTLCE